MQAKPKMQSPKQSGFTMVEMLIVILIVMVIGAKGVPGLPGQGGFRAIGGGRPRRKRFDRGEKDAASTQFNTSPSIRRFCSQPLPNENMEKDSWLRENGKRY